MTTGRINQVTIVSREVPLREASLGTAASDRPECYRIEVVQGPPSPTEGRDRSHQPSRLKRLSNCPLWVAQGVVRHRRRVVSTPEGRARTVTCTPQKEDPSHSSRPGTDTSFGWPPIRFRIMFAIDQQSTDSIRAPGQNPGVFGATPQPYRFATTERMQKDRAIGGAVVARNGASVVAVILHPSDGRRPPAKKPCRRRAGPVRGVVQDTWRGGKRPPRTQHLWRQKRAGQT